MQSSEQFEDSEDLWLRLQAEKRRALINVYGYAFVKGRLFTMNSSTNQTDSHAMQTVTGIFNLHSWRKGDVFPMVEGVSRYNRANLTDQRL